MSGGSLGLVTCLGMVLLGWMTAFGFYKLTGRLQGSSGSGYNSGKHARKPMSMKKLRTILLQEEVDSIEMI